MIFVTVGTHEQQFNRLIKETDRLKQEKVIEDEVFIQMGYSDYIPQYCQYRKFLSYDEMEYWIGHARLVITHGGPASFMRALSIGLPVIVVPRQKKYGEHVNDHQVKFCEELVKREVNISLVKNISQLGRKIESFNVSDLILEPYSSKFLKNFEKLIKEMF